MRYAGAPSVVNFLAQGPNYGDVSSMGMDANSAENINSTRSQLKTHAAGLDSMGIVKSAAHQARGIEASGMAQAAATRASGMSNMIGSIAGGIGSLDFSGGGGSSSGWTPSFDASTPLFGQ